MKENARNDELWSEGHRSYPLPHLPWIMKQTWNDLLFAHYPVDYETLRKLVPEALPLDSYQGTGWVGVIPFHMTGIRLRGLPPVPGTDRFAELNVRTYVTINGKPGVYFFSLDAANWLAVKLARLTYHLPYVHAQMKVERSGGNAQSLGNKVNYSSLRRSSQGTRAEFSGSYWPISDPFQAEKGSLEEWLTERYCLYTLNRNGVPMRGDIHHRPWPLQHAEAVFSHNSMLSAAHIPAIAGIPPLLHFSKKLDVRIWPLVHVK